MPANILSSLDWSNHFKAFKVSSLSRKAYCQKNNLIYHQFQYHYRHHHLKIPHHKKRPNSKVKTKKMFSPVKVKPSVASSDHFELKFPNGIRCLLPLSIQLDTLKSIIEVLQS